MQTTLITNRKREVEQEIARLRQSITSYEAELTELDTALRVLSRLSGAERGSTGEADQQKPAEASGQTFRPLKTMPNMILDVLQEAYDDGERDGLEPKEILRRIKAWYGIDPRPEAVSPICWRMWKRGQLVKDENSPLYRLPDSLLRTVNDGLKRVAETVQKNSAADDVSGEEPPAAEDQPNVQGRDASEGGGT